MHSSETRHRLERVASLHVQAEQGAIAMRDCQREHSRKTAHRCGGSQDAPRHSPQYDVIG